MAGVLIFIMIGVKWVLVFSAQSGTEEFVLGLFPVVGMAGSRFAFFQIMQALTDLILLYFVLRGRGFGATIWIGISLVLTIASPWAELIVASSGDPDYAAGANVGASVALDAIMVSVRGFGFLVVDLIWHGVLVLFATLHNRE